MEPQSDLLENGSNDSTHSTQELRLKRKSSGHESGHLRSNPALTGVGDLSPCHADFLTK